MSADSIWTERHALTDPRGELLGTLNGVDLWSESRRDRETWWDNCIIPTLLSSLEPKPKQDYERVSVAAVEEPWFKRFFKMAAHPLAYAMLPEKTNNRSS